MYFTIYNRALLRGITAGAVILAGASACSRSDKSSNPGNDQVQTGTAAPTDTGAIASQPNSANQPSTVDTATQPPLTDSAAQVSAHSPAAKPSSSAHAAQPAEGQPKDTSVSGYKAMANNEAVTHHTVTVGDSSHAGKTGERLEPTQSSEQANADTLTSQPGSDRVRPPEDSSETMGVVTGGDTGVASNEMARDTSTDTAAVQAQVDTTQQTEMAQEAPVDSGAVAVQVDTARTETDTAVAETSTGDTTAAEQPTEMAPQPNHAEATVSSDTASVAVADSTPQATNESAVKVESDSATVAAAGVESTGNIATGSEAVAQVTREGVRCTVVDPEKDQAVRWDLASSPATLNPCGTGTMTLPRVEQEK
jgi:hypothetical protein